MYYFTDKIKTERLINSELILTTVPAQMVENIIIGERSAKKDYETMFTCIHNPLVVDAMFRKFPYLQTMSRRNSLPIVTKGDIIFVVDVASDRQEYIMITVQ